MAGEETLAGATDARMAHAAKAWLPAEAYSKGWGFGSLCSVAEDDSLQLFQLQLQFSYGCGNGAVY
jgi:hypothetical protein